VKVSRKPPLIKVLEGNLIKIKLKDTILYWPMLKKDDSVYKNFYKIAFLQQPLYIIYKFKEHYIH